MYTARSMHTLYVYAKYVECTNGVYMNVRIHVKYV